MKYHALFVIFEKSGKILNCRLLQNIGGALHVRVKSFLTLCQLGNFACFLSSADFFQNLLFRKILSGVPSECQTVLTKRRA